MLFNIKKIITKWNKKIQDGIRLVYDLWFFLQTWTLTGQVVKLSEIIYLFLESRVRRDRSDTMEEITSSACLANSPQTYLVCITVHKAKSLAAFNSDTYVLVRCNQQTKRTVTYQNSEDPYFHDYFVFELFNDLQTLLRQIVNFTVMKKNDFYKRNENIGEVFIDLRTVWEFPCNLYD